MNFVIDEQLEKRFRKTIGIYFGERKGAISEAIGEAIELWLDSKSQPTIPGKTEISWTGKNQY